MIAGAITRGDVCVRNCRPDHLVSLLEKLEEAGVVVQISEDDVRVMSNGVVKSRDAETNPYPGFATDFQAQYMALMTLGDSSCYIKENVFENRFMHVAELLRMGADIRVTDRTALIKGCASLSGAHVQATDLRASASLVLAGLAAKGTTQIHRVYHLERGYERMETKLSKLGAVIHREKDDLV